ncbi:hypothetical protein NECID01_0144 [Nematocida sp. AWRm77]|nr:hypothetical protein NECID01_0144 [Nematocida sp. AWRm77]
MKNMGGKVSQISRTHSEKKVFSLDIGKKGLQKIPLEVFFSPALNWLIVSNNRIREIPAEIKHMKNLTRLALNDNWIDSVAEEMGDITNLTWVDLTRNRLQDLPDALANLKNIAGLGLSENRFEKIPKCVFGMSSLCKFGFFSNRLTSVPPEIALLQNLTKVDLSNNNIVDIPREICRLSQLIWLNLSNNKIKKLPNELGKLYLLQELGLGNNCLVRLPDLGTLKRLTILPVYRNHLEDIGEWACKLERVEKLDFSNNKLKKIPLGIFALKNLKYLNVKNNFIEEISLKGIPCTNSLIEVIDISDNQLKSIPHRIFTSFTSLATLRAGGNPYESEKLVVPPESPSLYHLCSLRAQGLPRHAWGEKHKAHFRVGDNICDGCNRGFSYTPRILLKKQNSLDGRRVIVKKVLCSVVCQHSE